MAPRAKRKNIYTQPLPILESHELKSYLIEESESLDAEAYNNPDIRILRAKVALLVAENSMNDQFDASIPYLAMNYFDRFISRHTLPTLGKKDVDYRVLVLAISCLCVAWKMRNKSFRNSIFLKFRPNLNVKINDINKVEVLVLKVLGWRAYCVNALCFLSNFLPLVEELDERFKANVIELIIQSQGDINFTQFKPSVIAASAIFASCNGLYSVHKEDFTSADLKLDPAKLNACELMMADFGYRMSVPTVSTRVTESPDVIFEIEEVEEKDPMNFELKWTSDEFQDLTIDPSLFPPENGDCLRAILEKLNCCICCTKMD
ncbi:cyclin-D6-1-like [Ricinus communis]|uniref:cyclin-D6-1-like n=1 Tax=Ricinus communis TaxID=3988 RepID=UPI00201A478C|nr:cyclin-D6-1-like [Ricinus communis]